MSCNHMQGAYLGAQYQRPMGTCQQPHQMNEHRLEAARQRHAAYERTSMPQMRANPPVMAEPAPGWHTITEGCQATPPLIPTPTYDRETLLNWVTMQDFEVFELSLYLDTHPGDLDALDMYRDAVLRAKALRSEYESRFGPLTHMGVQSSTAWTWEDNPWPWDTGR